MILKTSDKYVIESGDQPAPFDIVSKELCQMKRGSATVAAMAGPFANAFTERFTLFRTLM